MFVVLFLRRRRTSVFEESARYRGHERVEARKGEKGLESEERGQRGDVQRRRQVRLEGKRRMMMKGREEKGEEARETRRRERREQHLKVARSLSLFGGRRRSKGSEKKWLCGCSEACSPLFLQVTGLSVGGSLPLPLRVQRTALSCHRTAV